MLGFRIVSILCWDMFCWIWCERWGGWMGCERKQNKHLVAVGASATSFYVWFGVMQNNFTWPPEPQTNSTILQHHRLSDPPYPSKNPVALKAKCFPAHRAEIDLTQHLRALCYFTTTHTRAWRKTHNHTHRTHTPWEKVYCCEGGAAAQEIISAAKWHIIICYNFGG